MIDVNQQRFFILSEKRQFDLEGRSGPAKWNDDPPVLRLRSTRALEDMPVDRQIAGELADQTPVTIDAYGTWARVDETGNVIIAGGVLPDSAPIHTIPNGERIVDMAMNPEGILYAIGRDDNDISTIYLINRRGAGDDGKTAFLGTDGQSVDTNAVSIRLTEGNNRPDRIVALSGGGALLLDRANKAFSQIVGKPMRAQPTAIYSPETPRPCLDGPRPQELIQRTDLILPPGFDPVDMAANPDNETAILLYPQSPEKPAAVILISDNGMSAPVFLDKAMAPYSIGWAGKDEWALLFKDKKEAFVYPITWGDNTPDDPATVSGRRYPLNWGPKDKWKNRKFVNGLSRPVYYQSADKKENFLLRPLYPLSFPSYAVNAVVGIKDIIDSGQPHTVWHRLFLEANIPKGTGVTVYLAAGEDRDEVENQPEWSEHHFGSITPKPDVPRGVWFNDTSEVPFFKGLLYCAPQADTAGVFNVLIQRPGYVERSLKGRYLNVKIELTGGGHTTPEISALRIYYPRFSYLDRYLPELYRETNTGQKADGDGNACGADFLRRLLCLFEGFLTHMEDKVACSYMLTNPVSAPKEALDWLGQWIGLSADMDLAEEQKRLYIQNATKLYRRRGTLKGLTMALDLITGDWVKRGDIVLLEDFRLRRTFATILGADLSIEDDPLLMGRIPNANSYIGETMFLGEEEKKEFLALYTRDFPLDPEEQEQKTVDNFYARLANRLTVLVHKDADVETLGLIGKIVTMEAPAHIDFRVVPASKPLLIGLYSLLGVDTYMREEPERRTARVGHSYLGRYDFIRRLPVLDDRLEP